jgi:hypothetical protein
MNIASRLRLSLLLSLLLGVGSAFASTESAEAAVRDYHADLQSKGLRSVSAHMHRDELLRFKEMLLPIFQPEGPPNHKELVAGFFGPDATPESVAAAPPAVFMNAFMSIAERQLETLNYRFGDSEVVGSIQEGDVTHVLTRVRGGAAELKVTQMEVVSVRKDGAHWRLLLTGRYEGMAQAFRAQAQRRR